MGGSVWVKLHSSPRKFKVSINDSIDDIVKPRHTILTTHTSPKATSVTPQDVTGSDLDASAGDPLTSHSPPKMVTEELLDIPANLPPYTPAETVLTGPTTQAQVHPIPQCSPKGILPKPAPATLVQA
jgi:hypothetical protein